MRKAHVQSSALAVLVALVAATTATSASRSAAAIPGCATSGLNLYVRDAHRRHRQPGLPALVRRQPAEGLEVEGQRPDQRQGLRDRPSRMRWARSSASASRGEVGRTCRSPSSFAPGKKSFDFDINQISYTPARAKVVAFSDSYYDVNQALVVRKGTPIAKAHTIAGLKKYKLGRRARDDELRLHRQADQAEFEAEGLRLQRQGRVRAQEQADRRPRRRPPDRLLRHGGAGAELEDPRPVPQPGAQGALRDGLPEGQPAPRRA